MKNISRLLMAFSVTLLISGQVAFAGGSSMSLDYYPQVPLMVPAATTSTIGELDGAPFSEFLGDVHMNSLRFVCDKNIGLKNIDIVENTYDTVVARGTFLSSYKGQRATLRPRGTPVLFPTGSNTRYSVRVSTKNIKKEKSAMCHFEVLKNSFTDSNGVVFGNDRLSGNIVYPGVFQSITTTPEVVDQFFDPGIIRIQGK